MSSTPVVVQASGSPVRPRPQHSKYRQKSTSNIPSASQLANVSLPPRHHKPKGKKSNQQQQTAPQPINVESNLTKSLKSMPHQLQHSHSEPYITKHVRVLTPPSTPTTTKSYGKAYQSDGNISNGEKAGKKKKNGRRPRNISMPEKTSPPLPAQESPPHSADESAMPTGTPGRAYAGPTFHHSPAPSALALPSFLSKSVPLTPHGKSLATMMAEDSSDDSPPAKVNESPLAKLFKADSEERAKRANNQRGLPINLNNVNKSLAHGPLSPNYTHRGTNSPFPERVNTPPSEFATGQDTVFDMEVNDKRPSQAISPSEFHSRYRTTSTQDPAKIDAIKKRREKAMALKQALLKQSPDSPHPKDLHSASPSPKPRAGLINSPLNDRFPQPLSPPREHIHHKKGNMPIMQPRSSMKTQANLPQDLAQTLHDAGEHFSATLLQPSSTPSKDPKALENYLRWALKIDTPVLRG